MSNRLLALQKIEGCLYELKMMCEEMDRLEESLQEAEAKLEKYETL